jgi:hypothetical protein
MGPRGAGPRGAVRGRLGAPPPGLLSIGVVEDVPSRPEAREETPAVADNGGPPAARGKRGRGSRGRGKTPTSTPAMATEAPTTKAAAQPPAAVAGVKAKRARTAAKKGPPRPRAKKTATSPTDE